MNCLSCGASMTPGSSFCEQCGTAIAGAVGTTTAPAVPPPDGGWTTGSAGAVGAAGSASTGGGLKGSLGRPSEATSGAAGGAPAGDNMDAAARYQGAVPGQTPTGSVPVVSGGVVGQAGGLTGGVPGSHPGGYDPTAMMPSAVPPKGRGAFWFGIGGGVALVAMIVILAIVFLGKSAPAKFSSVGDSTSMADSSPRATGVEPPTTSAVEATVIDGVWPAAASWASSRCDQKGLIAYTSLETSKSKVVICTDDASGSGSATYTYSGYSGGLWSPWLDATYDEVGQQFIATAAGATPTTYTVSPTSLRIDNGGVLESFQYASGAKARGKTSSQDLLAQLESLMESSSTYRATLTDFVNGTFAGNACLGPSTAASTIKLITENRSDMSDAAHRLVDDAAGTSVASAAGDFASAMDASLQVDQELQDWVGSYWTSYAEDGCDGSVVQPVDAYSDFSSLNASADAAKQNLVDKVNDLAAGTSLKSDWKAKDV